MERNIEKSIDKALKKSSPFRAWNILFLCACIFAFAVFLRLFVFSVWDYEGKRVFVCELALCKENSQKKDLLLAKTESGSSILLLQLGKSGDSLKIPTPFDSLKFDIPKPGDTIIFETLNPMLWDAFFSLYKELHHENKIEREISIWGGEKENEKEIPFAGVGKASISGRPVSEREVAFLPWYELRLLELQLQKIFPAYDSIYFKRKLLSDSIEVKDFIIDEELFYLSCEKPGQQKLCYDSREKGFFRKSRIQGIAI